MRITDSTAHSTIHPTAPGARCYVLGLAVPITITSWYVFTAGSFYHARPPCARKQLPLALDPPRARNYPVTYTRDKRSFHASARELVPNQVPFTSPTRNLHLEHLWGKTIDGHY